MSEDFARCTAMMAKWLQPRALITTFRALLWLASVSVWPVAAAPPYEGTVFLDPNILTQSDPTALRSLTPRGRGDRIMFDRRVNGWITAHAYLFATQFDDGLAIEIQVNPEFSAAAAVAEASKYAESIGRLPTLLRAGVETVWLHRGRKLFGGGNKNILIHLQMAEEYMRDGFLEEALMHEGAHSSLDPQHRRSPGWRAAQAADGKYISKYALDHPDREDLAESFVPYFAVRHRVDRLPKAMRETILKAIPNRVAYFDSLTRETLAFGVWRTPPPISLRSVRSIRFWEPARAVHVREVEP